MDSKMILLVLFLFYPYIHCDIDRREDGFSASFEIINIGRMYETFSPMSRLDVYACAVKCIYHLNCKTINHNHKRNLCELVDRKFDKTEADISNPDWANYGTPDKIDGNFSAWQKVGACSVTCGNGTQMERRSCDNPQPRSGGKPCQGKTVRQVECDTNITCPVHGSWSSWVETGFCSTCTKERTCSAPSPRHNGLECLQSDNVTRSLGEVVSPCKLCEVKNVAVLKPSSQSSNLNSNTPARLGNDGGWWSYAITQNQYYQWWQVDIQEIVVIEHIIFWGYKTDGYRNKGLYIKTLQKDKDSWKWCCNIGTVQKDKTVKVTCGETTAARFMRVQSNQHSQVYIRELQVYAYV